MKDEEQERAARLKRISEIHDAWVKRHVESSPFDEARSQGSGDYSLWHLDADAPPDVEAEFQRAVRDL